MEAPEVPLEQVQEDIHHHTGRHARPGHGHGDEAPWTRYVALSTALIAALAAFAALCAGHTETEAMQAKMNANDEWSYFQAKSIKLVQLETTGQVLAALGKQPEPAMLEKMRKYDAEKGETQQRAKAFAGESERYLEAHTKYGYAVTMFQVAIALSAIAALTRRRRYWLISLGLGAIGVGFAAYGGVIQHHGDTSAPAAETAGG